MSVRPSTSSAGGSAIHLPNSAAKPNSATATCNATRAVTARMRWAAFYVGLEWLPPVRRGIVRAPIKDQAGETFHADFGFIRPGHRRRAQIAGPPGQGGRL